MEALIESLSTGFAGLATNMLSAIGSIVPVMLPVVGGIAVVGIGIKLFKKLGRG